MRAPVFRGYSLLPGELVVDSFAGGGGASTGIEAAIGRPVDIAINHNAEAIAMHKANHPETRHFCEDIWAVDPINAAAGRPVGLAWFSPDCTHFSRAKGGQPRKKEIRGLAWVVIDWAKKVCPRLILLENVEEFATWGPLDENGHPISSQIGETFRQWLGELTACGYSVEFKSMIAADYGTPTTRKRLFLIARRDGAGIAWPDATHGAGRAQRWRPAAEIIDWSLPCPSIFDRKRPLAPATMKRIAAGIQRYVIGSAQPFVMAVTHHKTGHERGVDQPLKTVTAAHRGELAVCEPFVVRHGHVSSITGLGDTMRGQRLDRPLATVCATNDKHLVAPIITKHYGGVVGHRVERTIGTITSQDHHALSAAFLMKYHGTFRGQGVDQPMLTVDTRDRFAEVRASLRDARGQEMDEPLRTLDTSNRFAEVRAFLTKFYGTATSGASLDLPFPTVTAGGDRGGGHLGLVMIAGEAYEIADIGMRMLQPHELFAAQGFPDDYDICPEFNGKPMTKTAQTALAGNSVCPQVAEALVMANARGAQREAA
jgi:DNA (cytosine-5)-methyltransferase 1